MSNRTPSTPKLRLLALAPQEPWPATDGGREGIHGAVQALAQRARVLFSCPGGVPDEATRAHFASIGVDYRPAPFVPRETPWLVLKSTLQLKPFKFHKYGDSVAERHLDAVIGDWQPDAIVCFHAHMEELGQRLKRRRHWRVPVIVREHNIEYKFAASYRAAMAPWLRPLAAPFEWLTVRAERRIWQRADAVAFLSDHDHAIALASGVKGRLVLAPEGVPIPPARSFRRPDAPHELLLPLNRKAPQSVANLQTFLHSYWALVAGQPALADTKVSVTGVTPEQLAEAVQMPVDRQAALRIDALGFLPSLAPAFERALAVVAPTFIGGGIRKKMLEAMANQVPVIATDLDIATCRFLEPGRNILPLGTPEQFVGQVRSLIADPGRWLHLAAEGRSTVERFASWDRFGEAMIEELRSLVPVPA